MNPCYPKFFYRRNILKELVGLVREIREGEVLENRESEVGRETLIIYLLLIKMLRAE